MKQKILVAEDDPSILTGLVDLLESEGYIVVKASDGVQAIRLFEREHPDLVLLDVMMPQQSGYDVCRQIRAADAVVPVLMLTAKGQEVDKVVGLELGADDYIVKPFGINELLARVRAAFRRVQAKNEKPDTRPIEFGAVRIDPKTLEGRRGKEQFEVTPREVRLLQEFQAHEGEVIKRDDLLERIWGVRFEGTTRTLDQHIAKLRQKIEADPADPRHIVTVHGVGYRFYSGREG
jgi:DNA-binding response OmpR family regulator